MIRSELDPDVFYDQESDEPGWYFWEAEGMAVGPYATEDACIEAKSR